MRKKGEVGNQIIGNKTTSLEGNTWDSTSFLANTVKKQIILQFIVGSRMHNAETTSNLTTSKDFVRIK